MTYDYAVTLLRVVDGDTVDLRVDLGFHLEARKLRFRILGINTPERGYVGWAACTAFLRLALLDRTLRARTHRDDDHPSKEQSIGRWLADIYDADTGEYLAPAIAAFMAERRYLPGKTGPKETR